MIRSKTEQLICLNSHWKMTDKDITFSIVGLWCVGVKSSYTITDVEIKFSHMNKIKRRSIELFTGLIEEGKIIRIN